MPIRPELGELRRAARGGKCCASSHSLTCGTKLGLGELADAAAQQLLLVGQPDVHAGCAIVSFGMRLTQIAARSPRSLVLASRPPAFADATVFLGSTTTPANRAAKGFAVGVGLLVVGFEFEYRRHAEDAARRTAPSLRTGMGNVLLQTPVAIRGFQPYFTTGGGVYRERLGTQRRRRARRSTPAAA